MDIKETNKILKKLNDYGFRVISWGDNFDNPFEIIDEEYFNEKVNEALEKD